MAKKTRPIDDAHLDVFEAIKRAFIRRGFVPARRRHRDVTAKVAAVDAEEPDDTDEEEVAEDEPAESSEKLVDLAANAHEVLAEATTIFPFTLFPGTVTIDREKLTIANRSFFKVASISSMPITDVQRIEANVGPFFGSIVITRVMVMQAANPFHVKFLWRDDALKIQRLLQGYIIAHQKKIDCSVIDKEQLIILLNDLGQGVPD